MKKYKINIMKWNLEKYNSTPLFYQKFQILLLMENANTHLVSIFKDHLLFDDMTEFFREYYVKKEIFSRLKTIFDYYESSSYLFPNYTAISEGKYIYRNIIRKQKLIDYLEDLEDKMKEKEEKKNLKNKTKLKNNNQIEQSSSSCEVVFDTKIYENIRKETENDSKINELFCVGNNSNDLDSFSSILKLAEELKERDSKNKDINNSTIKEKKNINHHQKINSITENINETERKIYVSRRTNMNQNPKIYNKKTIKKGIKNININNFKNKNNSGLITRNFNLTERNKNNNKLNLDPSKSNDFIKTNQNTFSTNKYITAKYNYKKNNIIINIINNNKNTNYNNTNNYFPNYNFTNPHENYNPNSNKYFYSNYVSTDNNYNYKNNNQRIYTNQNTKNNNFPISESINSKRIFSKPKSTNHNNKINKTQIKSKLLSFRLTDSNFIQNLTERIKNKTNSNSRKGSKNKSISKSIFSPINKNITNNMKKRTKTEILGNKTDIFIFGQQPENISYNKSINRQILKNINLTNNKPHKEIFLVNKKIINYHFNMNNNLSNKKTISKHISTNSQNLTDKKIINKIIQFSTRDAMKKNGESTVFSVNKTERTSRNHSKDKMNKVNNTTIKKNYLDSFSPKKSQDLIYNKIKNKKNDSVYTFLKSINSNKRIKNIKDKISNYSIINNTNYKGVNKNKNYKELHKRILSGKNF